MYEYFKTFEIWIGSPGVINYYRRFMGQIYDTWDKQIDIYGSKNN